MNFLLANLSLNGTNTNISLVSPDTNLASAVNFKTLLSTQLPSVPLSSEAAITNLQTLSPVHAQNLSITTLLPTSIATEPDLLQANVGQGFVLDLEKATGLEQFVLAISEQDVSIEDALENTPELTALPLGIEHIVIKAPGESNQVSLREPLVLPAKLATPVKPDIHIPQTTDFQYSSTKTVESNILLTKPVVVENTLPATVVLPQSNKLHDLMGSKPSLPTSVKNVASTMSLANTVSLSFEPHLDKVNVAFDADISSAHHQVTQQPFSSHLVSSRMQMPVTIQFGQPQWNNMVAERAAMMVSQNIQFAELQIDPPELGPIQVKVTVNQDQASVTFVSAHAQVRDALEQTSFRLRELLDEQAINLSDLNVSDQEKDHAGEENSAENLSSDLDDEEPVTENSRNTVTATYGIDQYA